MTHEWTDPQNIQCGGASPVNAADPGQTPVRPDSTSNEISSGRKPLTPLTGGESSQGAGGPGRFGTPAAHVRP